MAGRMAETYTVAELSSPTFAQAPGVQDELRQYAAGCA